MKYIKTILSILLPITSIFAQINISEKVSEVTVYSSSAEMRYHATVDLKKGENKIILSDLSPFIIDNSIHVEIGGESVNIITVMDRINYFKEGGTDRVSSMKDSVSVYTRRGKKITNKIEVLEKEKNMLFREQGIGGVSNGVAVSEIEKASEFFHNRYSMLNEQIFNLEEEALVLTNRIGLIESQISQMSSGGKTSVSEIIVVVISSSNQRVVLDYSFLTYNAGWAPLYDIKYMGPEADLDFVFRANVFNASNTEWEDVSIKLSTASPSIGFSIPSLSSAEDNAENRELSYQEQEIMFRTVLTNNAIAEYEIDFSYTIPSDGKPYLVDVKEFKAPSSFSYTIIPKLDKNGFLMANIPNWNDYNLISGTTNIYNHGTYLGKTFLNTNTNNDTLEVYLGKDNQIEAYREEIAEDKNNRFIGNYYIDKTKINYTIRNGYDKSVKIKLIDQVPVFADGDKVKMNISNIENAVYDKGEGSVVWNFSLQADNTVKREFGYTIKSPRSKSKYVKRRKVTMRTISCPSF